jgi:biopolymer transport protein ExbD
LVKLNHEFLADQAVLKKGASVPYYQNMVLAFSSNAIAPSLANAIHYSSIKKRIVIMKTQTSKKAIWLRSLLLIPLLALLLYSFSTKEIFEIQELKIVTPEPDYQQEVMEQEKINDSRNQNIPQEEISIAINKNGQLLVNVDLVKLEDLKSHLLKFNQDLTKEEREQSIGAIIRVTKETPENIIKKVEAILLDYGVATIDIKGPKKSQNTVGASQREINEYNTLAEKYNAQPQETRVILLKDVKTMETIYSRMTDDQKQQAQPFPKFPPPPPPAPATAPAKKLEAPKTPNAPLPPSGAANGENKNKRDPQKKVEQHRLILIEDYNKMYRVYEGLKQKENKTENEKNALIALFSHLEKSYVNMTAEEKKLVHQPYPPSSPKTSLNKTINGDKESHEKPKIPKELAAAYGNLYAVPQPPPQPNEDPVKYIKELAEKGATFYMGPHQYKTDEVIELVKKNKDPRIDVSDYPIVRLGGC